MNLMIMSVILREKTAVKKKEMFIGHIYLLIIVATLVILPTEWSHDHPCCLVSFP